MTAAAAVATLGKIFSQFRKQNMQNLKAFLDSKTEKTMVRIIFSSRIALFLDNFICFFFPLLHYNYISTVYLPI